MVRGGHAERAYRYAKNFCGGHAERAIHHAKRGGQERIRTFEGVKPADLQSAPVDRLGTCPCVIFTL